jgi:hypothetical protein
MDDIPRTLSENDYNLLQNMDKSQYARAYKITDIHRVILAPVSKVLWDISPTSRAALEYSLSNGSSVPLTVSVNWIFERVPTSGIIENSVGNTEITIPRNSTAARNLVASVLGHTKVSLSNLFPAFFHLDSTGVALTSVLPEPFQRTVNVSLMRLGEAATGDWWNVNQTSPHVVGHGCCI